MLTLTPAELLDLATAPDSDSRPVPRTMVVVAHPDDEVLALGGRLSRHRHSLFVQITDGAPLDGKDSIDHGFSSLEEYRLERQREAAAAFLQAGIPEAERICFEVSDQQAANHLGKLIPRLIGLFRSFKPEIVFTHPYEGGHPDHDACAVIVYRAVTALEQKQRPMIAEATYYHAGPDGIEVSCFLPQPQTEFGILRVLTAEESRKKQELLACFSSQRTTLSYFRTDAELYRIAPKYDFSRPPHEGKLFYERFPWGMTGARFCELVKAVDSSEVGLCN